MARLSGKIAVVTGAAQGIGATFAEAMAAEGAKVVLADIDDPEPAAAAIRAAGAEALAVRANVADPIAVANLVRQAVATFGTVHILVNNAAIAGKLEHKPIAEIGSEEWARVIGTNLGSVFECTKAVIPVMQAQGYGKIVNMATAAFFLGADHMAHYLASKGGIIGFSRSAARELGASGIRVNVIAPGLTMSQNLRAHPLMGGELGKIIASTRALAREEVPEDLIGTLLYLASADSDFVTGQTIVVDGGGAMH